MKTAYQEDPDKQEFTIDGRKVTEKQLAALMAVFPGDWIVVRFEDPPFTATKKIHERNLNDLENGND